LLTNKQMSHVTEAAWIEVFWIPKYESALTGTNYLVIWIVPENQDRSKGVP